MLGEHVIVETEYFENMNSKMVYSNTICNAIVELQRQVRKHDRACILTLFGTICNFREHFENKVCKVCTLILFETV